MRRLVLKADQFAAEAVVAEQRLANLLPYDLRRFVLADPLDWRTDRSCSCRGSACQFLPRSRVRTILSDAVRRHGLANGTRSAAELRHCDRAGP